MGVGGTARWPLELRLRRAERLLDIAFDDGSRFSLPAEYLRVESPSAEVQGHGPGQKTLVHGRVHVGIIGLEPIGNYAVRITFDDLLVLPAPAARRGLTQRECRKAPTPGSCRGPAEPVTAL